MRGGGGAHSENDEEGEERRQLVSDVDGPTVDLRLILERCSEEGRHVLREVSANWYSAFQNGQLTGKIMHSSNK